MLRRAGCSKRQSASNPLRFSHQQGNYACITNIHKVKKQNKTVVHEKSFKKDIKYFLSVCLTVFSVQSGNSHLQRSIPGWRWRRLKPPRPSWGTDQQRGTSASWTSWWNQGNDPPRCSASQSASGWAAKTNVWWIFGQSGNNVITIDLRWGNYLLLRSFRTHKGQLQVRAISLWKPFWLMCGSEWFVSEPGWQTPETNEITAHVRRAAFT